MIVLVDTNVLLDVLQGRHPFRIASERIWQMVETRVIEGHVAAISFNNAYYVMRKQVGHAKAVAALQDLRRIFRFVPFDDVVLDRALSASGGDFEDSIQSASAASAKADYVVTRDSAGFAGQGTLAVTPEQFLALVGP